MKSTQERGPDFKDGEPEMPAFSMKGLGASSTVKFVVYTALGVLGTMETVFYGQWAYRKLYPEGAIGLAGEGT